MGAVSHRASGPAHRQAREASQLPATKFCGLRKIRWSLLITWCRIAPCLILSSSGVFFGNCEILARFQFGLIEALPDTELYSAYLAQLARECRESAPGGRELGYLPEEQWRGGFAAPQALRPGDRHWQCNRLPGRGFAGLWPAT